MACMCGDTCCPSCGPAQGNFQCPLCRAWGDECDHYDEETGEMKPEFHAEAALRDAEEDARYGQLAHQLEEEARLAERYWREQDGGT